MSLSSCLRLISDSRFSVFPVHLSVVSLQLCAPSASLFLSPLAFIINSCDAAQQSLSEWYTSTITNKPKYLHSAGMICIDQDWEVGRVKMEIWLSKSNFFLFHQNLFWFLRYERNVHTFDFFQSHTEYSDVLQKAWKTRLQSFFFEKEWHTLLDLQTSELLLLLNLQLYKWEENIYTCYIHMHKFL